METSGMQDSFGFRLLNSCPPTGARTGLMKTAHGDVKTPCVAPIRFFGNGVAMSTDELTRAGVEIVSDRLDSLAQTPALDSIAALGGIHRFSGWQRPIIARFDPNGLRAATDRFAQDADGLSFWSHRFGRRIQFDPVDMTRRVQELGFDIGLGLLPADAEDPRDHGLCRDIALRWAIDGMRARTRTDMGLLGPAWLEQDKASGEAISPVDARRFDGLWADSRGEPGNDHHSIDGIRMATDSDRPDHLWKLAAAGFDVIEVSWPVRYARLGLLVTSSGTVNLKDGANDLIADPPDKQCGCPVCSTCSRALLRFMHMSGEPVSTSLNAIHNLYWATGMMTQIRAAIDDGSFANLLNQLDAGVREPG